MKKLTKLMAIIVVALVGITGYLVLSREAKATEPAKFEYSDLIVSPSEVAPGQLVTISVTVKNIGGTKGSENVKLVITDNSGNLDMSIETPLTLKAGESKTYSLLEMSKQEEGTYTVEVADLSNSFKVVGHEEKSKELAEEFILENSSTYKYDGYDLEYKETLYPDIAGHPYLWTFVYEFKSKHSGYGDRTGENLLQVITPHEAHITVDNGKVVTAILDLKWDMIEQKMLEEKPTIHVYKTPEGPNIDNAELVWEKVKDLEEARYVTMEKDSSALIYVHPYSVGAFDPSTAETIIVLSSTSGEKVRTAIFRLDSETNQLKKAYNSSYDAIENFKLEQGIELMEEKISELSYGERDIPAEEVKNLHPYYVYSYPAGDFGGTLITHKQAGKVVFYATTVWDGSGELLIPQEK
ncbi:hypothetical protein AKJ40_00970 [candidate division MSBL1 archaeon SCGC-AAA259M10]|uniref:CARDB domain-containing protein n=2 Tax=candidate division MSBL1 TaxID=215777 RepID=A0A133V2H4_9EURY|nr:hypothetical protein AKJ36_00710 [candidate division MSBL1 archaeon SCGC-AAA259I07]KXB00648.1 hypothetical protein AKJ40_00970 [candidate division MSBL1 archaeon SCGC-AAA259M10]